MLYRGSSQLSVTRIGASVPRWKRSYGAIGAAGPGPHSTADAVDAEPITAAQPPGTPTPPATTRANRRWPAQAPPSEKRCALTTSIAFPFLGTLARPGAGLHCSSLDAKSRFSSRESAPLV